MSTFCLVCATESALAGQPQVNLATDDEGRIYLAGTFFGETFSIGNNTIVSADPGQPQPFVAYLNPSRSSTLLLALGNAPTGASQMQAIAPDQNGGAVVSGFFEDGLTVGGVTLDPGNYTMSIGAGGEIDWSSRETASIEAVDVERSVVAATGFRHADAFVFRFSDSGSTVQETLVAGRGSGLAVAHGPDNTIYHSGSLGTAVHIGKLDSTLSPIWEVVSAAGADGWASDIGVQPDGALYVVGQSLGELQFEGSGPTGPPGVFFAKFSAGGALNWMRSVSETPAIGFPVIKLLPDGAIALAIPFRNPEWPHEEGILIREYTRDGQPTGTLPLTELALGPHDRHFFSVTDDRYYIATTGASSLTAHPCVEAVLRSQIDVFAVDRSCLVVGTNRTDASLPAGLEIDSIYPNPISSVASVTLSNGRSPMWIRAQLFDVIGQRVGTLYSGWIAPGKVRIDLPLVSLNMAANVYYLRLDTANGTTGRPVIYQPVRR